MWPTNANKLSDVFCCDTSSYQDDEEHALQRVGVQKRCKGVMRQKINSIANQKGTPWMHSGRRHISTRNGFYATNKWRWCSEHLIILIRKWLTIMLVCMSALNTAKNVTVGGTVGTTVGSAVLYSTVPYVPCCTLPFRTVPYCIVFYCTLPYGTVRYCAIRYHTGTVRYGTVRYAFTIIT